MDFNEYVIRTRETVIYAPEVALHYLIPGLLVEALELENAPIDSTFKEAGDVCYFVARIADELGITVECKLLDTETTTECKRRVMYHAWNICDIWVKVVRDGTNLTHGGGVLKSLEAIIAYIGDIAAIHDLTLPDIMQANVDKLADRKARGVLSGSGDNR